VAKQEKAMDLRVKGTGALQTPWACGHTGDIWYANVHAEIRRRDRYRQRQADQVDRVMPQKKSTFFGRRYYSFVTREYLLNLTPLLLPRSRTSPVSPVGHLPLLNQWVRDGFLYKNLGKWMPGWAWRFVTRARRFARTRLPASSNSKFTFGT
jgi:hypothetical protein